MLRVSIFALAAAGLITLVPADAHACGGCLNAQPPTEADAGSTTQSPSVVTDHRMVLSLTGGATTLWDQIEYAGDPEEFAWVLPIRGKVTVGLGSDAFVDALDKKTAPSIIGPRVLCNAPPQPSMSSSGGGNTDFGGSGSDFGCGCGSSSDTAAAFSPSADAALSDTAAGGNSLDPPDEGVVVTERAAVGPYETLQISGTDTESIVGWLRRNNYEIPANVEPILTRYVTEGFDFLAVRLRPGIGVHAMRPIRVSWPGSAPMLPLRMVAAGVGERVGIKLFVLGDGRWKTKNFDTFTIPEDRLVWDFNFGRSSYTLVRDELSKARDDRAFALESSIEIARAELPLRDPEQAEPPRDAGDAGDAETALAVDAGDAGAPATDIDVAFGDKLFLRVTRLRGDLPVRHLATDLELEADLDQDILETRHLVSQQVGAEKLCPYGVASIRVGSSSSALSTDDAPKSADCAIAEKPSRATLPVVFFGALALCALGRKKVRGQSPTRR